MKIRTNEQGYVTDYALIGDISDSVEVSDFTDEELDAFTEHYQAYRLTDNTLIFDEEQDNEIRDKAAINNLRRQREHECFPIINRGELWYKKLTSEQTAELDTWYQAWLDVTETKEVPVQPEWIS